MIIARDDTNRTATKARIILLAASEPGASLDLRSAPEHPGLACSTVALDNSSRQRFPRRLLCQRERFVGLDEGVLLIREAAALHGRRTRCVRRRVSSPIGGDFRVPPSLWVSGGCAGHNLSMLPVVPDGPSTRHFL